MPEHLTPGGFPYRQHPHNLCGSNSERQEVGDPGHCEDCCSVGHSVAHPDLGCGDVGCYRTHGDETHDETATPAPMPAEPGIASERLDETPETMLSGELRAMARTHASEQPGAGQDHDDLWNRQVAMRDVIYEAIKDNYDADGFDWRDIPSGHFNRIVKIVSNAMVARADAAEAKLAEMARRCTAFESALHQEVHTCEMAKRERDETRAKLDEIGAVLNETRAIGATAHQEVGKLRDKLARIAALVEPVTEHADDCEGCDGPGQVPCAADRVIGGVAYRNGEPIKNLAERTTTEAGR